MSGCLGSEVGNPPFEPEPDTDSGVDVDTLVLESDPHTRGTILEVAAGGLVEGTTRLFITNLETTDPVQVATPDTLGGARGPVARQVGGEVRLQVEVDGGRLAPIDVVTQSDQTFLPAERALGDCLLLEARDYTVAETGVEVRVKNGCAAPVVVGSTSTRLSSPAFRIDGDFGTLSPDQVGRVVVASTGIAGPGEDVLFLHVTEPLRDRRPITLRLAE